MKNKLQSKRKTIHLTKKLLQIELAEAELVTISNLYVNMYMYIYIYIYMYIYIYIYICS